MKIEGWLNLALQFYDDYNLSLSQKTVPKQQLSTVAKGIVDDIKMAA